MQSGFRIGDTVRIVSDDGGDGPLCVGKEYKVRTIQKVDPDYPIAVGCGYREVSPKLGSFILVSKEVKIVESFTNEHYVELLESLLPDKIIHAVTNIAGR